MLATIIFNKSNQKNLSDIDPNPISNNGPLKETFIYGTMNKPFDFDPQVAGDSYSFEVFDQVYEGLFRYNLSDPYPSLAIIPNLATTDGTWSPDGKNYTVTLRQGVTFHDGTKFNATAVNFTFSRLAYFIEQFIMPFYLVEETYFYWDIATMTHKPIINRTEIVDEYTIKFVLNTPYAPLPALLCFSASYILSPTSTNATSPIDIATEDLVGTGPFEFDGYVPDKEINFHAFDDYWRGKADIETMKFLIITDSNARINALLEGEIDFLSNPLPTLLSILKSDPNITVLDSGTSGSINYLGMNNKQINKTLREAVSYSINYSHIIEVITENQTVRLKSPIPNGILYANDSFNVSVYDLTWARLLIKSMFPTETAPLNMSTLETNSDWRDLAASAPLLTWNYTYITTYTIWAAILPLLQDNLAEIGINITDAGMSSGDFFNRYYEWSGFHRDMLQLFFTGWGVYFNDPSNYINTLMTNRTVAWNGAQINDSYLQDLMEEGLNETNPAIRKGIYEEIQRYCVEDLIPWAFCYTQKLYHAHYKNLTGFQQNAMGKVYFYPCQWNRALGSRIPRETFIYGTTFKPFNLDPQVAADYNSFDIIDQVCEGLFRYNLSDPYPSLAIIPNLAAADGTWSPDDKNYTVTLRQGVTFHDGTKFNATAVNFTFNRLAYFSEQGFCVWSYVYRYWDIATGTDKIIINRTEIVDEYTIKFVLNTPFAPLKALLCLHTSYILSPSSTNPTVPIDTVTGDLIGTGPFVYDGLIPDFATNFHAFDDYWRGKADIEKMRFLIITDSNARINALLTGIIDFLGNPLPSSLPILKADPNITVLDSGTTGITSYLGMNNKQINKTLRHAISYSVNYSYIIEVITGNQTVRLKSPIPNGILYANDSFNFAKYNLTHARLIMQSMGFGVGFDIYNDAEWENAAATAPFRTFNYSYTNTNPTHAAISPLLQDNLGKIGINVTDAGMTWWDLTDRLCELDGLHRDHLQLFFTGWGADYNDPSDFINPLMSNRTIASNGAQINDWYLQDLMEKGLNETDPTIRKGIYDEIQRYCVEDLMPWAFGYVSKLYHAHYKDFTGFQQNAMQLVYFYPCQWSRRPSGIEITPPSDITYFVGVAGNNITWTITADYVLNPVYYIYVNGSLNQTNSWESGVPVVIDIDGLSVGSYEYQIEVHNGDEIVEDIVIVTVNPQPIIPGYPLEFLIGLSFVIFYFLQKKIRRHPSLESDLANNKKNIF